MTLTLQSVADGGGKSTNLQLAARGKEATLKLRLSAEGELSAVPQTNGKDQPPADSEADSELVGLLHPVVSANKTAWYLTPHSNCIGINGITPPLPLALLQPGDLISLGDNYWSAAELWVPTPCDAPADVADQKCPICGCKLSLAKVVQHICGRWTHLERPDVPDDENALNCFLAGDGTCGETNCTKPATLEPLIVPEPSEQLLSRPTEDDLDW